MEWKIIANIHKAVQTNNLHPYFSDEFPWEASKVMFLDYTRDAVMHRRNELNSPFAAITLATLLLGAWRFKSTLDQDKVYSLVGLAVFNERNHSFRATYDVDLTTLLCEVFSRALLEQRDTSIFYNPPALATLPEAAIGRRPSWVPDVYGSRKTGFLDQSRSVFSASGDTDLELAPFEQGNRDMAIKGRIIGEIETMIHHRRAFATDRLRTPVNEVYPDITAFMDGMADYERLVLEQMDAKKWADRIYWKLDFGMFVCLSQSLSYEPRLILDKSEPVKIRDAVIDVGTKFRNGAFEDKEPTAEDIRLLEVIQRTQGLRSAIFKCYGRDKTSRGRAGFPLYGWVPSVSREGDRVTTLNGVKLPIILRPAGSNIYCFCGLCYVQGIMLGEHEGNRIGLFGPSEIEGCQPEFIRIS